MSILPAPQRKTESIVSSVASKRRVFIDLLYLPSAIAGCLGAYARAAAIAVIAIQALLLLFASATRLMLNADGAYFVFAISAGSPWDLKWVGLPTRVATFLYSVIPTELVSEIFDLSGSQIAIVNGVFFYGFHLAQFIVVTALAWRVPHLLIFPVVQYAISTALGFGFPSEILAAPGFFWICTFSLLRRPVPVTLFAASFTGLVFTHELALLGAVLIFLWAWAERKDVTNPSRNSVLVICVAVLAGWFSVRLAIPSAADSGAIYLIDPRRYFNNPTLGLIVVANLAIAIWALRWRRAPPKISQACIAIACAIVPWMLAPWTDFAQGRYEFGRTLVGLAMPIAGILMIVARLRPSPAPTVNPRLVQSIAPMITATLAITFGSSLVFMRDWNQALNSFQNYVGYGQIGAPIKSVTFNEMSSSLSPREIGAIRRTGYNWSWPYRSVVLAKNYRPQRIVYDPGDVVCEHYLTMANAGDVPIETRIVLADVVCSPTRATIPTIRERIKKYLAGFQ